MTYRKERDIEQDLIAKLQELKYTYRHDIRDLAALKANFRQKFEALNRCRLTDSEFARLHDEMVSADVFTASKTLREKHSFIREDSTPLICSLVNVDDWCKNEFEVINQLRINTESSHHRYDVMLLINGVPVVQIELKSHQIVTRKAIEQIVEYKNDPGNGYTNSLLCFMQLFVVSNEHHTYYFTNNHRQHFSFNAEERFLPIYQLADQENENIAHLHDFADGFLAKCTLGQMISRYMVLVATEQKLLIMRPYQIYAVKAIIDCVNQNRGNGYIWHTTGSGKTLTSFKASTLLKANDQIDKCLFVVDRKDLDRQTRDEFNKFQENCVEENTNTEILIRRLLSEDYADKVIVTTIQKLGLALDENSARNKAKAKKGLLTFKERLKPLSDKRMVFIFDECHRSQFGDNHTAIKTFFPKAQLFGFTGTPIFEDNSSYTQIDGTVGSFRTTKDLFEKELHSYTITNAIADKNVLSFHIDFYGKESGDKQPKKGETPPPEAVVDAILSKHDNATDHRRFNAILATSRIDVAIKYYQQFKQKQADLLAANPDYDPLNIACVFSPPAEGNKDVIQLQEDLEQEKADNQVAPEKKKQALVEIIDDYNRQYDTNHRVSDFDQYYKDVQQRIKDHQYSNADYPRKNKIDIVIVVDMLLTGFDSKYLNTLYVDKNLKYHGLIQAFSRTNRVLNDTKPWGNILDFRAQEDAVEDAIELFSGKGPGADKEIWLVDPAPVVVNQFKEAVSKLESFMEAKGLECCPSEVANLKGDTAKAEFIDRFKEVQKLKTQLDQYTDLSDEDKQSVEALLPEETLRGFKGSYLQTAQELKSKQEAGSEDDDRLQQLDFEFVLFASAVIDYDYIMSLIAKSTQRTTKETMTREELIELISATANMMEEREDIIEFINSLKANQSLTEQEIRNRYQRFKSEKSARELSDIAGKHGLEVGVLQKFVDSIISRMIFDGEALSELFDSFDYGWKERARAESALMTDLAPHLNKLANGREISGLAAYE